MKKTKNNKKLIDTIDTSKIYEPSEAIKILIENSYTKFEESLEEMESEDIQTNYQPESVNKRNPVKDKQSILSRIFQGRTDRY